MNECSKSFPAFLVSVGLLFAGFFPGYFYYQAKMDANFVTVKGLAEMDVRADLAVWDLKFVVTNDNIQTAQQDMDKQLNIIKSFLINQGFEESEIYAGRIETNDLMTNPYRDKNFASRYILSQNITVKSNKVDMVEKALSNTSNLVAKGVVFDSQTYGSPVSYIFTKLNDVKPQMLEEATKNAYTSAQEFAKSANTSVGMIRDANQGVFSILPREQTMSAQESTQINKKVRVVVTVKYFLE